MARRMAKRFFMEPPPESPLGSDILVSDELGWALEQ